MTTPGIPPNIQVPGIVGSIPQGYLLGRISPGQGPVQLVKLSDLLQSSALGRLSPGLAPPLSPIADKTLLANISGATATPLPSGLSAIIDNIIGSTRGGVLYRGATAWSLLAPGTSGNFLKTQGAGADPLWDAVPAGVTGANPTATASDTAVNGVAATFMRSDAAPAIQKLSSTQFGVGKVDGTTITATGGVISAVSNAILPGYIFQLELSTAGASSTFGIAAGSATDDSASALMALSTAWTKTTSAWAAGTGNGALDTGAIANNTWYHVFLISKAAGASPDILVSTSLTPTMPATYTLKRRIGSLFSDGSSKWRKFFQFGNTFIWDVPVNIANPQAVTSTGVTITGGMPPGVNTTVNFRAVFQDTSAAQNGCVISSTFTTVSSVASGNNTLNAPANGFAGGFAREVSDTTQGIRAMSLGTGNLFLNVAGWEDLRGAGVASGSSGGSSFPTAAMVHTGEATTSTTYTDLTTVGPSVTMTTGSSVLVTLSAMHFRNAGFNAFISVDVSGATTVAASDTNAGFAATTASASNIFTGAQIVLTGLTPGSNTFKVKYRVDGGASCTFQQRAISVQRLN